VASVCNGWKADIEPADLSEHHRAMRDALRRTGAWLLMALVFLTAPAFWFFIIVTGLSGGNRTMAAAAGACLLLVVIELLGMRLMVRQQGRFSHPERLP
jgi:hypothetical protein